MTRAIISLLATGSWTADTIGTRTTLIIGERFGGSVEECQQMSAIIVDRVNWLFVVKATRKERRVLLTITSGDS